eukprot:12052341-Ditylum_brightwellii.AAC.1
MLKVSANECRLVEIQNTQQEYHHSHPAEETTEATTDRGRNKRAPFVATLSRCHCDLHTIWHEYEFGIGGRKAAKDFSPMGHGR